MGVTKGVTMNQQGDLGVREGRVFLNSLVDVSLSVSGVLLVDIGGDSIVGRLGAALVALLFYGIVWRQGVQMSNRIRVLIGKTYFVAFFCYSCIVFGSFWIVGG